LKGKFTTDRHKKFHSAISFNSITQSVFAEIKIVDSYQKSEQMYHNFTFTHPGKEIFEIRKRNPDGRIRKTKHINNYQME